MLHKKHRIHFVGIGGIGMSGIAEVLLNQGYTVSGSDLHESEATARLRALGAAIFIGHEERNLTANPTVVVASTAVKYSNPEVLEARRRQIPVIPRAEMLAELMRSRYGVAVAGSHGKTTTTSMLAHVLSAAGLDPTMVIGGRVRGWGINAKMGQGEFLVAEADESDGSFLVLSPTIAVVTNIDREHMDYHRTMERLNESFLSFVNKVPFYGLAVLCVDDANVRALLPKVRKRCTTYGLSADADFSAQQIHLGPDGVEFSVVHQGAPLGALRLRLPGRHSATNALAVVAVARELEIPFAAIAAALQDFAGIHRRFEARGEAAGVLVIDDYGHHPAEIRATLAAIRDSWKRPLTVIFQPHRYSRTQDLFDDFVTAFDGADRLVITNIYAAGEDALPGVSGEALYQAVKKQGHLEVAYVAGKEEIAASVCAVSKPGDIVLTLGAGDVYKVGEILLERLIEKERASRHPAVAPTALVEELKRIPNLKVKIDEPLGRYTSMKIGGPADYFIEVGDEMALQSALPLLEQYGTAITLLGNGSNVLVSDRGVRGAVIHLAGKFKRVDWSDDATGVWAQVGAACPVTQLVREAARKGYAGLEFAEGIPGTVGGALVMNAGAYGSEFERIVDHVEGVTRQGAQVRFMRSQMNFTYRESNLPPGVVVTGVRLRLSKEEAARINARMRELVSRRKSSQPAGYPNSGSMFRNPSNDFAGRLIEAAGLKGKRIGQAQISERHANFIVNLGGAKAEDVRGLMSLAQAQVKSQFGVELVPEVRFVGEWPAH